VNFLWANCIVLEFKYTTLYDMYINFPFYSRIQQDASIKLDLSGHKSDGVLKVL